MLHVAWSVCLSVCLCVGHEYQLTAVQKRLNRSRCRLGAHRLGTNKSLLDGVFRRPRRMSICTSFEVMHCNLSQNEFIAYCFLAAAGECACQRTRRTTAFAAATGDKTAMRSIAKCKCLLVNSLQTPDNTGRAVTNKKTRELRWRFCLKV